MTESPAQSQPRLQTRVTRSAFWLLATSMGSRAVGLAGTLLLARYLTPADYGIFTAASILVISANSMTTLGVGTYLVATREISRETGFHVTCWFLATGLIATLVALVLSDSLAGWLDAPALVSYMPILAVVMIGERITYIPERLLVRDLRFRRLSIIRATGELTFTAVALMLAMRGVGVMSLVWGMVARSTLRFLAIVPVPSRRDWLEPHPLRLTTLAPVVRFGVKVSAAGVATFAMRRWDNLLIGRFFGPEAMGAYNYAYNLADTPAVAVGEQMTDVLGASFAHLSRDNRAAGTVRAVALLGFIMLPLGLGLGVVAPTLGVAVFDEKWRDVGSMLMILAVISASRPLGDVFIGYFYATGHPRLVIFMEWLSLLAIGAGIILFGRVSILVSCVVVGCVFVIRSLGAMYLVTRYDQVPPSALAGPLLRTLAACVPMVAGVFAVRSFTGGWPAWQQLMMEVAVGAVLYVASASLVARPLVRELLGLVRTAVRP